MNYSKSVLGIKLKKPGRLVMVILLVLAAFVGSLLWARSPDEALPIPQRTDYERYLQASFNKPTHYPIRQAISPTLYRPIAPWMGRLILPPKDQLQTSEQVWFEVYHAPPPYQSLVGQWVNLSWSDDPRVQRYVDAATQDIQFNDVAQKSLLAGNLHPTRLNGVQQVGPLESLAGARSANDVTVALRGPVTVIDPQRRGDRPTVQIQTEPTLVTGRFYGLVTILGPSSHPDLSPDRFEVQHYNPTTQAFDGPRETVHIPQVSANSNGVLMSTNRDMQRSPLNAEGWYIYGAQDDRGTFVVQAIEPRHLLRIRPDAVVLGEQAARDYIRRQNWQNTEARKGTAANILVDPVAVAADEAVAQWQEGDRAIVLHLFGGIGGEQAEAKTLGVVTGHSAYGLAEVVREPITAELRFEVEYYQVYAHNSQGIISGTLSWPTYMGDLQRGWLGSRPVSDVIIKFDPVTTAYDFGGLILSPLAEFTWQQQLMTARYRTGDGTGAAVVTPATSCVQDSNQALYRTIKSVEARIQSNPQIQTWLTEHPDDPQTLRFRHLQDLSRALEQQLAPLGIVRKDWQQNAQFLEGTRPDQGWVRDGNLLEALRSWRTLLPRRAHDEMAQILLDQGASQFFARTNQVGGFDPKILPLAPTTFFR